MKQSRLQQYTSSYTCVIRILIFPQVDETQSRLEDLQQYTTEEDDSGSDSDTDGIYFFTVHILCNYQFSNNKKHCPSNMKNWPVHQGHVINIPSSV